MRLSSLSFFTAILVAVLALSSCAAGRKLQDDGYSLVKNKIIIESDEVSSRELSSYIRQHPPGFSLWNREKVTFSERLMETSVENMIGHLHYLGYYNADVSAYTDIHKKNRVTANYRVRPGERYRISEITYVLPEDGPFAADFLADTANVSIKPGDFLSEASLEKESERSAAVMRTKGYYGFSKNYYFFEADTLNGPDAIMLEMRINEYTRNEPSTSAKQLRKHRISDVTLSHSASLPFRDRILENLNTVRPGMLYDEADINTTYQRMSALKLFNTVGVELTEVDTNLVRCDINLGESRIQGFKVELEASSNSTGLMGVSPQLTYHHKNIFHGGEWLNLNFRGNFQFKFNDNIKSNEVGVSAGLSFPKFLGLPYRYFKGPNIPRTELNTSFSYQDRPEYTRSMFSMSYGYSGRTLNGLVSYQIYPVQANIVRLFNLDPKFSEVLAYNPFMWYSYQNHFDAGMGGLIYYSKSGPGSMSYVRTNFDLSGNTLSLFKKMMASDENGQRLVWGVPYTQYVKAEVILGKTWKLGLEGKHSIASRFLMGAGHAYGNSTAIPFEKQFYCGGANSMRGWQARALGPGTSLPNSMFSIPSQTGDIKLEANLEYRFGIVWKLNGAVFADVGNIWDWNSGVHEMDFSKDFYKSLAADWGFGLRCDLNFFVIRLDMGIKLHDPSASWRAPSQWLKRDGFAVHFGVGYPF